MIGVKSVIFEKNGRFLEIYIGSESKVLDNGIKIPIDGKEVFKYLESLFSIIDDWQKEYLIIEVQNG